MGVELRETERDALLARTVGALGEPRLDVVVAGRDDAPEEQRCRDRGDATEGQTALTSSSPSTRNEEPQPQAATTLGLFTWNPAPVIASM